MRSSPILGRLTPARINIRNRGTSEATQGGGAHGSIEGGPFVGNSRNLLETERGPLNRLETRGDPLENRFVCLYIIYIYIYMFAGFPYIQLFPLISS